VEADVGRRRLGTVFAIVRVDGVGVDESAVSPKVAIALV
jgi:hypothetical protein